MYSPGIGVLAMRAGAAATGWSVADTGWGGPECGSTGSRLGPLSPRQPPRLSRPIQWWPSMSIDGGGRARSCLQRGFGVRSPGLSPGSSRRHRIGGRFMAVPTGGKVTRMRSDACMGHGWAWVMDRRPDPGHRSHARSATRTPPARPMRRVVGTARYGLGREPRASLLADRLRATRRCHADVRLRGLHRGARALATYAEPHCYDLCAAHSERLTAPRGWEVLRLAPDPESIGPSSDDLEALADAVREAAARPPCPRPGPPPARWGARRGHLRALRTPDA
jgi:hypothetical protein